MENPYVPLGIRRTEVKGGKIFFSKKFGGFNFLLLLCGMSRRNLNLEFCKEIAHRFTTKSDLYRNDQPVYNKLLSFGMIDELFPDSRKSKYSFEECKNAASKCGTKNEFKKKFRSQYGRSHRKGWFEEITTHMSKVGTLKKRLVYQYLFSDGSVYVGITFNIHKRIYGHKIKGPVFKKSTQLNEWIEPEQLTDYVDYDIALNMESELIEYYRGLGKNVLNKSKGGELGAIPLNRISKDEIISVVKHCDSRWDFQLKFSKHYSQAKRDGILQEVCKDLPHLKPSRTKEDITKIVNNCCEYKDFYLNFPTEYEYAVRKGWIDDIMKNFDKKRDKWEYSEIEEIVKNYQTRTNFLKENRGAYETARQNGWLKKLFVNLPSLRITYELEDVIKIVNDNNLKKRTHLANFNKNAYEKARTKGWLDIIFP